MIKLFAILFCIVTQVALPANQNDAGVYIIYPDKKKTAIEKWTPDYQKRSKTSESILSESYFINKLRKANGSPKVKSSKTDKVYLEKQNSVVTPPNSFLTESFEITDFAFEWLFISTTNSERKGLKYGLPINLNKCIPTLSFYVTNGLDTPISLAFRAVFIENTSGEQISTVNRYVSKLEPSIKKDLSFRSTRSYLNTYDPKTKEIDNSNLKEKKITVRLYAKIDSQPETLLGEFSITPL